MVDVSKTFKSYVKGSKAWRVENADLPLRNLIRHALFADVGVQAVEKVSFLEWSGPIERSIVALHLGQLPVRGDDELVFEINKQAEEGKPLTWVTSDDIHGDKGRIVRQDRPFLIAPLLAGQKLHCVCKTRLSTGRERTQWSSVFPVLRHDEDGDGCTVIVETTGALTPEEAWIRALLQTLGFFNQLAKLV